MTRNLADLKLECEAHKLTVVKTCGRENKADYERSLREFYWNRDHPGQEMPEQIAPMLARNVKDVTDDERKKMLEDYGDFVAQEKINGCRAIIKFNKKPDINHVTSRRLSDETYRFNDLTDKLPHYRDLDLGDEWADTIVDGELLMPCHVVDTSIVDGKGQLTVDILQATAATMNCDPAKSVAIQAKYGKLVLHAFDCLRFKGKDLRKLPLITKKWVVDPVTGAKTWEPDMEGESRFAYLAKVVARVHEVMGELPWDPGANPHDQEDVHLTPPPQVAQEDFLSLLAD